MMFPLSLISCIDPAGLCRCVFVVMMLSYMIDEFLTRIIRIAEIYNRNVDIYSDSL